MHTRWWRFRSGLLVAALAVLCGLSLGAASGAQAYIYWVNSASGSIGRANLDGTGVNQNFITGLSVASPSGVAVDPGRYDYNLNLVPTDTHIYWTNGYGIGRANLDGSDKNVNFIQGLDQQPMYVAVYNTEVDNPVGWPSCWQERLVWTVWGDQEAPVGTVRLPGCLCSATTTCWQSDSWALASAPNAVAAGATGNRFGSEDSGYVYWTEQLGQSISRANLDEFFPTITENFIPTATNTASEGVAIFQDAYAPGHDICTDCGDIYWVNRNAFHLGGSIGRANLDGTGVNQNFISLPPSELGAPEAVAVDPPRYNVWANPPLITSGAHIYWTMPDSGRIGRANLDGSGVDQSFITGAAEPWGVAVDAGGPAPSGAPQEPPNVAEQINAAGIPKGLARSLIAKLRNARAAVRRNNTKAALNLLRATANQIDAQSGKAIPSALADRLVADLNTIRASID